MNKKHKNEEQNNVLARLFSQLTKEEIKVLSDFLSFIKVIDGMTEEQREKVLDIVNEYNEKKNHRTI